MKREADVQGCVSCEESRHKLKEIDSEYTELLVVGRIHVKKPICQHLSTTRKYSPTISKRDEAIQHAVRIRSDAGKVVFEPRLIAP